jgi:glycosyltransferase involved in cell wall biosynthesis
MHIQRMRLKGLEAVFTIYDLISLRQPELVPRTNYLAYRDWLRGVLRVADQLVCISRTVADDLVDWLDASREPRSGQISIDYCHLGVDHIKSDAHNADGKIMVEVSEGGYYIMVGAVEPRKGYQEAVAAFERLWSEGFPYDLVIVGRLAGLGSQVVSVIRSSPFLDRKLHWYERCDDLLLSSLYRGARCLVANSRHEGFGLPVIEAALYNVPVLARDVPVFREICGDGAFYFNGDERDGLYNALLTWERLRSESRHPLSSSIPLRTWSENAMAVVAAISTDAESYAIVRASSCLQTGDRRPHERS